MVLVAILPEYVIDVYFAWARTGGDELAPAPIAVAAFTGTNHVLIGLVWPLAVLMHIRKSGGRLFQLGRDQRAAVLLLLLAALYAFTIYLKSFLSPFDTLFLLLLFGAYMWATARPQVVAARAGEVGDVSRGGRRTMAAGALVAVAIGTALASMYLADSLRRP
jgi:cation:H+ antiporter